jgi:hypothetical protein
MENNRALLSNHHTQLISHTSDDITTSITGVYPDRHGVATAANSYQVYNPGGTTLFQSGFTYWTSKARDGQYNFTSAPNTNAPALWVPFTRAGCNVGAAAMTGFRRGEHDGPRQHFRGQFDPGPRSQRLG